MSVARVLVLDDDDLLRTVLAERLERQGHDVRAASTLAEARAAVERAAPDIAFLDIKLPDGDSLGLLEELARGGDTACLVMTAHATVKSAVEALKLGAIDYIEKPLSFDRVDATLAAALELTALRREVRELRERAGPAGKIVAESPAMREVLRVVEQLAPADTATVLIEGETGTGKGVVAKLIHRISRRADGPFVTVTCSALAETIMESELFGHEKGAFTDARAMKRGLVELADGGSLFLDEIGELSPRIQGKLLGFLEEKNFRRVGGTRDLSVDARIIAATNRDLAREVREGRFREDLYYRLSVLPIRLPPLRERRSDVAPLAQSFIGHFNAEFAKRVRRISPDAMALLERHPWPGNVRELRNVIERSVLLTAADEITADTLPAEMRGGGRPAAAPDVALGPRGLDLEDLEQMLLEEALRRAEGNRTEAGRLLGLSRHQVRNRLKKFGLEGA